jgi:hypothetical protein
MAMISHAHAYDAMPREPSSRSVRNSFAAYRGKQRVEQQRVEQQRLEQFRCREIGCDHLATDLHVARAVRESKASGGRCGRNFRNSAPSGAGLSDA